MTENFETLAETEERMAALSGQVVESEPEDIHESLTVCCANPSIAARNLCGCGGIPQI